MDEPRAEASPASSRPVFRRGPWLFALLLAVLFLLGVSALVGMERAKAEDIYKDWSAFATFWGFIVGVVGFSLTIWTVLQIDKVNAEARRQIEEAVKRAQDAAERAKEAVSEAQEESRRAIVNIGLHLLESDNETFGRLVAEVRRLGELRSWPDATQRCREATQAATLLSLNPFLEGQERTDLQAGAADLAVLASYIQQHRIARAVQRDRLLPEVRASVLERMATLVVRIKAGVRRRLLEVPHGSESEVGGGGGPSRGGDG